MRIQALVVALIFVSPLVAQLPDAADRAFDAAVDHAADEVHAIDVEAIRKSPPSAIAIARRTTGGAPESFRSFARDNFGPAIAEELLASYGDSGPAVRVMDRTTVRNHPVVALEEFQTGTYEYDWQRLNEKYPDIRYVVRITSPLLDRQYAYAIVRYEVIGRKGREFASMAKFERQNDGSWKGLLETIGDIWE